MSVRSMRTLVATGLLAGMLVACQAPGFMGLNGESTIPGLGMESYSLARVPIRVLLPAELVPGRRSGDSPDVPADGAKVYLALDPSNSAETDAEGIAPLTIPVNGIQLIRAEVRTSAGTMVLEGMMGLPFSRERETSGGPNTVSLPSMKEFNEPLTLSLASTLVAAHLQERYTAEQIRYLDPMHVLGATREVAQVLKAGGEGYRTAALPDLTDTEDVRRVAGELANRHSKVAASFRQVFSARIPELLATPSATASALPEATASVDATASAAVFSIGSELFPLKVGESQTFTMSDSDGKPLGKIARSLTRVVEKSNGVLAYGRMTLTLDGKTSQSRFLIKRQANQIKLSFPFRPELTYPLPFIEGAEWVPAAGLKAQVSRLPGEEDERDSWQITVTGELKGKPVAWTEVYQPEVGLTAFTWGNEPESPMVQVLTAGD